MVMINVGGLVSFATNLGVLVEPAAVEAGPEGLLAAIRMAFDHLDDSILADACCGGEGPLANYGELSIEEYLRLKIEIELRDRADELTREAKRILTRKRRGQFNRERNRLALALIDSGAAYVCAVPGCAASRDLTIDHKIPLSRGGSDELGNFQFMCQSHNSAKGDRHDFES